MINVTLYTHPHLYAGIDDWGLALDEINGAGVNDSVWVDTFDASSVSLILIWGENDVWDEADFCINGEDDGFAVMPEENYYLVDPETQDYDAIAGVRLEFTVAWEKMVFEATGEAETFNAARSRTALTSTAERRVSRVEETT